MSNESARVILIKVDRDLEDLIPRFMENTRQDIREIAEALLNNDLETIRRIGHSMKSYGSGYGFHEISAMGGSIETAALTKDMALIEQTLQTVTNYLNQVMVVYA